MDALFFPPIKCAACGRETDVLLSGLCADCRDALGPSMVHKTTGRNSVAVYAPYVYDGVAGMLVRNLKFGAAGVCADILADGCAFVIEDQGLKDGFDTIVPVPISRRRLGERGFNQSELVARRVGDDCSMAVDTKCLIRIRHTAEQMRLGPQERQNNVKDAFSARGVAGKRIILLDDVYTTGATSAECAAALMAAGACDVIVLCCTIVQDEK